VQDKFLQGIDEYWQDTTKKFEQGANGIEEKFQEYIQHLREICSNDQASKNRIENLLFLLRELKDFFVGIPWREPTG
jgi:hypothetical protein